MHTLAPADYTAVSPIITLDSVNTSEHCYINITDDMLCEADEMFEIVLTSLNDKCNVTSSPVPVFILNNDRKFGSEGGRPYMCIYVINVYVNPVCVYTPAAEVSMNQPSYTVTEDVGQLEAWINLTCGEAIFDQECEIAIETVDGSAQGKLYFHYLWICMALQFLYSFIH